MFDGELAQAQRQFPNYFSEFVHTADVLKEIPQGANVLVRRDRQHYSLCKMERWETEFMPGSLARHGHWLIPTVDLGAALKGMAKPNPVWVSELLNVHCTHRLDFTWDDEFGFWMPHADGLYSPLSMRLSTLRKSGVVELAEKHAVSHDRAYIESTLGDMVLPHFFKHAVLPFLDSLPTHYEMPRGNKMFNQTWKPPLMKAYAEVVKSLAHGDFVYLGSKENVYLLALAKGDDGEPFYQGTYLASAKPPLFFTNSYLGHFSRYDMMKPLFKGTGGCNVAKYRTSDPPSFSGRPFICPHIGRSQQCKYTVFSGAPDLITSDLGEALQHFKLTDFSDYAGVVERYAQNVHNEPFVEYRRTGRFYI